MAGTIVVDRLESDASYASSINVASPMVISNTITMGSTAAITGNVNIDSGTLFVDGTNNRVGAGTQNPIAPLDVVYGGNTAYHFSTHNDLYTSASFGVRYAGDGFSSVLFNYGNRGTGNFWKIDAASGLFGITKVTNGTATLTNAIDIDGSGRVKLPYQPRFFAATRNTDSSASNLVFTSVGENVGSHYSNSTGRFTAPVSGTYVFTWGSLFGTNNTVGRFFLRRNGSDVGGNSDINQLRLDCGASGSEIVQGERTYIISATAGDYFNIYFTSDDGSSNATSQTYAFFSGWLLG